MHGRKIARLLAALEGVVIGVYLRVSVERMVVAEARGVEGGKRALMPKIFPVSCLSFLAC